MSEYSLYRYSEKDDYYLKYYKKYDIPSDETDYVITVEDKYKHKPKSLAYELFGGENLSWVLSYFNRDKLSDIVFDLEPGMELVVPTRERLLRYF